MRSFKSSYLLQQKQNKAEILTEVASKPRGRTKILNDEFDKDVCDYIRSLREEGGVINSSIVQSVGRGVVLSKQKTLLPEYGGSLELSREWARSILDRLNFRKRKATKGVKHLPEDFEKTKREYLDPIDKVIKENNISDQLVINWDQTGMFRKYFHLLYK